MIFELFVETKLWCFEIKIFFKMPALQAIFQKVNFPYFVIKCSTSRQSSEVYLKNVYSFGPTRKDVSYR